MKNIIISTIGLIKYGIVMGAGFLSFAQISFAAPVLTPATVSGVSRTSAILVAKVSNAGKNNVSVWFEWGETSSLEKTPAGIRDIYGEGYFQGNLSDLKEGTTYYFRAVAMLGSEKVTSPTSTFTTDGGATPVAVATIEAPTVTIKKDTAVKEVTSVAKVSKVSIAPKETTTVAPVSNANIASVIGAGDGVLPGTLIGWLLLFISILIAVIIIHTIYLQNVQRKKALEQAKMKMTPAVA